MTFDRENLPTLRRQLATWQAQYAVLMEAAEGDRYAEPGKRRVSDRDIEELSNRIDELSYVLRAREHNADSKIGVNWHTILAVASINGSLLVLILYLLFRGG